MAFLMYCMTVNRTHVSSYTDLRLLLTTSNEMLVLRVGLKAITFHVVKWLSLKREM